MALESGWRSEFPAGLLDPSKEAEESALKKLAAKQRSAQRKAVPQVVPQSFVTNTSPLVNAARLLASQAGVKNVNAIASGGGAGLAGGGRLQARLENRLGRLAARSGNMSDVQLANAVASRLQRIAGIQAPGMHHDGETYEKDINFRAGNEPRRKMMQVYRALYNTFGTPGNGRLQELIFRRKEYFGAGITRRQEKDHFDHLHYGFGD